MTSIINLNAQIAQSYLVKGDMMHARHNSGAVHTSGSRRKISSTRVLAILSDIPRDKTDFITGYRKDWEEIKSEVINAVRTSLIANVRIYGNAVIAENMDGIVKETDEYPVSAHSTYIKGAKTEQPQFLSAALVRQVFDGVEFSDTDMRSILQDAAKQVPRTTDEPPLAVIAVDGELIVTFAH